MQEQDELEQLLDELEREDKSVVRAAVQRLAERDDETSRHILVVHLHQDSRLVAWAIEAIADHGLDAVDALQVCLRDEPRRFAALGALGIIGESVLCPLIRPYASDDDERVAASAIVGLFKCGDRDGEFFTELVTDAASLLILHFLAAVCGDVPIGVGALDNFDAQCRVEDTPPDLRAACAWVVAAHDESRGVELAELMLGDEQGAFALASIVKRRGGPLLRLVEDVEGDASLDRTADTVGIAAPDLG